MRMIPFILIVSAAAAAAEYHLDPSGDDDDAGSAAAPWRTLAASLPRLTPGDTLLLHDGVWHEAGLTVPGGNEGAPVTVRNAPGANPIVDGGLLAFRTAPNADWEIHDAARQVYRSVQTFSGMGFTHGYLSEADGGYHLVPYEDLEDLTADNQLFVETGDVYVGPGLHWSQADRRIYVRLQHTQIQTRMGLETPAQTDPRQTPLTVFGQGAVMTVASDSGHVILEGLTLRHRSTAVALKPGAHHVTVRNCIVKGGRSHLHADPGCHHLVFDGIFQDNRVPPYIARSDVKEGTKPAHQLQSAGLSLGRDCHHVEVVRCEFRNQFDDIDAPNFVHHVRIHHNLFVGNRDDAFQLGSASYEIEFAHNRILEAVQGPSRHGSGASLHPGTKYIHHNIMDLRTPHLVARDGHFYLEKSGGTGMQWGRAIGKHEGEDWGDGDPWKIYQNTFLIAAAHNPNYSPFGVGHPYGMAAFIPGNPHEVYNNIFVQTMDHRLARGGRVHDGSAILDGNLYHRSAAVLTEPLMSGLLDAAGPRPFHTLAEFLASEHWAQTQAYYPPGWESRGVEADPQLDAHYRPAAGSPAASGGVALPAHWPDSAGRYRGALEPNASPVIQSEPVAEPNPVVLR